ncbi:MAG: hypothetical protein KDM63_05040 [Verrucomicrobiae bacterium]|nr:hypothetical protein [Verrucomicrobiae bacterium]MCB1086388.1 hypothetical protein [Verrucomicrobiae bacterium]
MKHRMILSAVAALIATSHSGKAEDSEPAVWKSKSGASFEIRKAEKKGEVWVLSILEGNNFGTITLSGTKAIKEVRLDLSRFRIEGNAPRTSRVEGTWEDGVFTFGKEVYEQVALPPQASLTEVRRGLSASLALVGVAPDRPLLRTDLRITKAGLVSEFRLA